MTLPASNTPESTRNAARLIRAAQRGVVLTGAGFSTPSGIPDFRSQGSGLWTKYLPMEVASLTTFRRQPELFYDWLRPLASHMLSAQPNPAHLALAKLEQAGFIKTIITQNIDGLHHRAGSQNILEVHGSLNSLTCIGCYRQVPAKDYIQPYLELGQYPHCQTCGKILKPDIILFEEQLPIKTWIKAEQASKSCDLMLVAGTSLEVMPSARLPMHVIENRASLIVVNKTLTYIDERAQVLLRGDIADIIPLLAREVLRG
jgi:NAD-dependent deacetylase